jgi:zinc/manganese transport system substrate-binding protein
MTTSPRRVATVRLVAVGALLTLVAGCGQSAGPAAPGPTGAAAPLTVVASTDVYGDIVATLGGDRVQVTSIIDAPDRDPHEYEADAQNQLALSKARLVVENGGGYDDFVDTMLEAAPADGRTVVNVADVSGHDQHPVTGAFNEHVWYDFPTMVKLADVLVADLSAADPDHAATFAERGTALKRQLQALIATEAEIRKHHAGAGVAITEPVPLYLLDAAGLDNRTPAEFSEAIEEDTDVPPAVLKNTLALFTDQKVDLLAYNEQTAGPETEQVLAAAKAAGVAVVPVTETLPAGQHYITWMTANLDAVDRALHG